MEITPIIEAPLKALTWLLDFGLKWAIPGAILVGLAYLIYRVYRYSKALRAKKMAKHREKGSYYDYGLQNKFNGGQNE